MNTTDPHTQHASDTGAKRCRCCTALVLALLILGPLAVYPPAHNYLRARHGAELVQQFEAPNADIAGLLKEMSGIDRETQAAVLQAARDKIIPYFKSSAEAAIDESKGHCDYDGALHILANAALYYPDSAELGVVFSDIRTRKAQADGKADTGCRAKQ